MLPCGITRPQWVNQSPAELLFFEFQEHNSVKVDSKYKTLQASKLILNYKKWGLLTVPSAKQHSHWSDVELGRQPDGSQNKLDRSDDAIV